MEGLLQKLSALSGGLSGSSGVSGGTSGSSPTQKLASDLERAKGSAQGLKKAIQDVGTASAQGLSETGKAWLNIFGKRGGSQGGFALSEAALKRNPHLAAMFGTPSISSGDVSNATATGGIDKKKVVAGVIASLFSPFIGARVLNGAGIGGGEGEGGVAAGIFGKGGSVGYAAFFIAIKASEKLLKLAFDELGNAARRLLQSFEEARQLYAKSLTSGIGLLSTARRGALSEIIGVSEKDIFQFGAAVSYLNDKVKFATTTLAGNATQLTATSYELKVVSENMKALWSIIAAGVAPSIQTLARDFNNFLVAVGKSDALQTAARILDIIFMGIVKVVGALELVVSGFQLGMKLITVAVTHLIVMVNNLISSIPGAGKLGFHKLDDSGGIKDAQDAFSAWIKEAKDLFNPSAGGKLADPQAQMKQLPASSWEKLGLVIGGGNRMTTNDLIKKSNEYLKIIAMASAMANGQTSNFGLSPTVANP